MMLREAIWLLGGGMAIGVPAAIFVTRMVSSTLYGLSPQDPGSITTALVALTGATVAAAYLPARRAAKTDPIAALRVE
jgi:ABC-type antimicrobial peptide transport system permease subunit